LKFGEKLKALLPSSKKSSEDKIIAYVRILFLSFLIFIVVLGLVVFALTMSGNRVVSVPNLVGKELGEAMEELQDYGLYGEVHLRNSRKNVDEGAVFSQNPRAGGNVRQGKIITLSVSRGPVNMILENYVGRMIDDAQNSIQSINELNGGKEIFSYRVSRIYDGAPVNEIIAQTPDAGTHIKEPVEITFQVSAGKWIEKVTVPDLSGKSFEDAMKLLTSKNIPFNFRYRKVRRGDVAGAVIAQTPKAEEKMKLGSFVDITIAAPKNSDEKIFGIFEKTLPVYEIPLNLSVYIKMPKINSTLYYSLKHPGGNVSIPYYVPEGTVFRVFVEDKEEASFRVE